jgi:hypothetical protein
MSWPDGWKREDHGDCPGATDGKQHVWIDSGTIKSYTAVWVPVKVISILLAAAAMEDEETEVPSKYPAWMLTWTESERNWGPRPDGISLHLDRAQSETYVKDYWARENARRDDSRDDIGIPDEYERPDGDGRAVLVSKSVFEAIKTSDNGIRLGRTREQELTRNGELEKLSG